MGSLLFLTSWGVLMGPITYSKHALIFAGYRYSRRQFSNLDIYYSATSYIRSEASLHGRVLWQHSPHAILLGELTSLHLLTYTSHTNPCCLSIHTPRRLIDCGLLDVTDGSSA